ncbi:MAG: DNA repair protein RadC [Spirochaetaceae bacterium]|jgi:DNA repair protein RadC|nr:DNA repair protein RadC [Spirochaetaceae bacterium]
MKNIKHHRPAKNDLPDTCIDVVQNLNTQDCKKGIARLIAPKHLPENLRPRSRLLSEGPAALSDRELLSILLNTGVKGKNVSLLADELRERLDANKNIPSVEELSAMIGEFKACSIVAMLEFGRRRWGCRNVRIKNAADIFPLIRHYADCSQERFISVSLNGAHEVLAVRVVTVGLVNKSIIHPREVFADVIADRASAICVAHNHPSRILEPSDQDDDVTVRLIKAANLLGINFLDHLIFTETDYYSYRAAGKMNILCPKGRGISSHSRMN